MIQLKPVVTTTKIGVHNNITRFELSYQLIVLGFVLLQTTPVQFFGAELHVADNTKGWTIHETFLSDEVRPRSIQNGVKVQPPNGLTFRVKSVHAAKCIITRRLTPA